MATEPAPRSSIPPLGANGGQRRRFVLHHVPLAIASALVLALFMGLPLFDAHAYPHADIVTGVFPQERREGRATDHANGDTEEAGHAGDQNRLRRHGENGRGRHDARTGPADHRGETDAIGEAADHSGMMRGNGRHDAARTSEAGAMTHDGPRPRMGDHDGDQTAAQEDGDVFLSRGMQQFTVATGYLGVGFLAVTLVLGPANLLLRRRNPVSTYLRRDVGIWTAIFSVVHVICAVLIHVTHGSGVFASFVHFFFAEDGRPLTNSFGWGNWTGLAATVIALALLVTSNDAALRTLKARRWKWLQRLNYALIVLVVLHAFFYGAFLRTASPFTLLLVLSVITVVVAQALGVWLWRRRNWAVAADY